MSRIISDAQGRHNYELAMHTNKDRVTLLPAAVKADVARHIERIRKLHEKDLRAGAGWVELPAALARKYPNAGREWAWQWVFPT